MPPNIQTFVGPTPDQLKVSMYDTAGNPVTGTGGGAATIADGADVTQGALADAAVAAGASGSLSAKLRRVTQGLEDLKTLIVLAAGTAILGKVGIDQTTPGTTDSVTPKATEVHLGEVGGNSALLTPTLAVTAAAYSAGNNVGGLLTVTGALRVSGGTGLLQSVFIIDRANQKAPLDILLFDSLPAGTFTDKAAFPTLVLADTAKVIRRVSIAASDYVTVGGVAYATISAISKIVKASGSTTLYAAINTSGTPTYAATTDLVVRFGLLRD